jgi:hypothetical protein
MNKTAKFKILSAFLFIIIGIILSGCSVDILRGNSSSIDPATWIVEIDPAHQACDLDIDCGLAYVDCSTCDCGVPINLDYEELYINKYEELCRDYVGPVCEMFCPQATLACDAGQCIAEYDQ